MKNMSEVMRADIQSSVKRALQEDVGSGDISAALIPSNRCGRARLIAKEPALVCGQAWVEEVFFQVSPLLHIDWLVGEGHWQAEPSVWAECYGPLAPMLTAERTALNFLQTLSAVATKTYHYVQLVHGRHTQILDTRKTIPGLRIAEKYAVRCGGATNHRMGLYDEFLIKENHIEALGSVTSAVSLARKSGVSKPIVVEVTTVSQFLEAKALAVQRVMLDNFSDAMIVEVMQLNRAAPCKIEVSGGVDLGRVKALVALGVDYISIGDLTKSIAAIDLSLLVDNTLFEES